MKFPIGYTFVRGFLTYEVVAYDEKLKNQYQVEFLKDDVEIIEMTEWELELSSNQGV